MWGYSSFTYSSFHSNKNKLDFNRRKDFMKKFYKDLRGLKMEIIDTKNMKMIPLTKKVKIRNENFVKYEENDWIKMIR